MILEGLNSAFQDDFSKAESSFTKLIQDSPQDPQGYFFLAGLVQAQMMDREDYSREEEFYHNIKKAMELSKGQIQKSPGDAWGWLFLGNSYGYLAAYEGKRGKFLSALKNGLKAKSHLKKAVQLDSTLFDAYLGLGSYYYWSSVVTRKFNWLPFFSDKRKEGIEFLKIAATRSAFSREAATSALVWVYINEGWYALAIKHSQDMCEKYPEGKLFLWAKAAALYQNDDWSGAYDSYSKLLEKVEAQQSNNYHNLIQCRTRMANALFNLGKIGECIKECEKILSYPIDEKVKQRQKDNLELAKNLKKRSEQKT